MAKLWIAVLVVLLLVLIVAFVRKHTRESPAETYKRSDGTFDEPARQALKRAAAGRRPEDHFLAATIITRNVLTQRGDARARREAYDAARANYLRAVQGVRRQPRPAPPARRPTAQPAPAPGVPGAMFMVDAALDFVLGGMLFVLDDGTLLGAGPADRVILAEATRAKDEERARRVTRAAEQAAPAARADAYIGELITHTDDPQNSHDTSVNASLRAIVAGLRAEQRDATLPSLDQIEAEVKALAPRWTASKLPDVLAVIARTRAGEKNLAVGITDAEALQRVWLRADHPDNRENRDKLREAVYDNLYDCWVYAEVRRIICVNGRSARILGSLALLDVNQANWNVETV
ncbi:MAG: hypothetical protein KGL39_26665, partial [Patescibacteria group bacterium]|nr:hypothetical protein [Patescibacteria group bacterium]